MRKVITHDFLNRQIGVRMPMNSFYKQFMNAVTVASNSEEDRFCGGVQCIIWGSLFIEALVNVEVERHLRSPREDLSSRKSKQQRSMWELVERAELEKKVEVLAQLGEEDEKIAEIHLKQLMRLIRLRNRLVHYKETEKVYEAPFFYEPSYKIMGYETEPPTGTFTTGDVLKKINDDAPNPDIVGAILSQSLDERRDEINDLAEWIGMLRTRFINSHGTF